MECPECGLINPDIAQRCDCGYDFETKSAENVSQEALNRIHAGRIALKKAVYWVITLIMMSIGGALAHWLLQHLK